MRAFLTVIWAESLKVRKSKIFWITLILFMFMPLMLALLMFVQKYPDLSAKLGMIGAKASMLRFGNADWHNYLGLINQAIVAIGLMGFGFVTSWVFGREYVDHTLKDILALPIRRSTIVLSKLTIIILWCTLLALLFYVFAILAGLAINLSGRTSGVISEKTYQYVIILIMTLLLITPVAFFACYGRGYLLSMGFVILTLILANFTGLVGLGSYFPWTIPGLFGSPSGTEGMVLSLASYLILIFTGLAGLTGTIVWWQKADQK